MWEEEKGEIIIRNPDTTYHGDIGEGKQTQDGGDVHPWAARYEFESCQEG